MIIRRYFLLAVAVASIVVPKPSAAQALTGTLVGTVKDEQGGALPGARAQIRSPALMGGSRTLVTNEGGQLWFPALSPGSYVLDIELQGFAPYRATDIEIAAGTTLEVRPILKLARTDSALVIGVASRIDARNPGLAVSFGPEDLGGIPTRHAGMLDFAKLAPGISPTSLSSGVVNTLSAFGSGTNENMFLLDAQNTTCPCNGVARAEVGVDFIREVQVQSVGASAEYGNMQGAAINIVTRSGSNSFLYDASYYGQSSSLTAQPVQLACSVCSQPQTGYERAWYRDFTTTLGGPIVRDRLWFFAGSEYLRDADSQAGTDPRFPRTYEQNKLFVKLTWQLAPGWQLDQSLHQEFWVNADRPTVATPFESTTRPHATVPAITFGHLTHIVSASTLWDVRVGRFVYDSQNPPSTGDRTTPNIIDQVTGITQGGPASFGGLWLSRLSAKTTVTHYRPRWLGGDHEFKAGGQIERGLHHSSAVIPTGVRFVNKNGQPFQAVSSPPANTGGLFITTGAFVTDALTLKDRVTIDAGLRLDHSRAVVQDLHALDAQGRETDATIAGLGTLYTWDVLSPRLGFTAKLTADGRAMLRASYGRFSQGVFTGEIAPFHPGATAVTTTAFDPSTGGYTIPVSVVDGSNLVLPGHGLRAPHTDEYSLGVDREIGRSLSVTTTYVHKTGANFIGWTDIGGQYHQESRSLGQGVVVPVFVLDNGTSARRFQLTNPDGYSMAYDGLVMSVENRRSRGWHAFGSYTFSRARGLQASSGTNASGAQASTVAPPANQTFGRDPNDLTNARGRLPNDRPQLLRVMGSVSVPWTGLEIAANLQYGSGKPWAASAQVPLSQGTQRVLIEPRGARRLSSQTLLDLRVSRTIRLKGVGRVELMLDVLNVLNDTSAEGVVSDNFFSTTFGQPNNFVDPRRAMLGVRFNLGR